MQKEIKALKQTTSTLTPQSLSLLTGEFKSGLQAKEAWTQGTNIVSAVKEHPKETRWWIYQEVAKLVKEIDANKTLSSNEEIEFCCRSIIEEHPTLKLDEIYVAFNMIRQGKFGKLYERLKSAEILDCLRRYESDVRSPILERDAEMKRKEFLQSSDYSQVVLEPLGLAGIFDNLAKSETEVKGEGIGSRLRKKNEW